MSENKIYVGNLPFGVNETDLEAKFAELGNIESVNIIRDRDTGNSKGFGFIEFSSNDEAVNACSLDGTDFEGRNIRVNIARKKTEGGGQGQGRRQY